MEKELKVHKCKEFICLTDGDYILFRKEGKETLEKFTQNILKEKDSNEMLSGAEEIEFVEVVKYIKVNNRKKK